MEQKTPCYQGGSFWKIRESFGGLFHVRGADPKGRTPEPFRHTSRRERRQRGERRVAGRPLTPQPAVLRKNRLYTI